MDQHVELNVPLIHKSTIQEYVLIIVLMVSSIAGVYALLNVILDYTITHLPVSQNVQVQMFTIMDKYVYHHVLLLYLLKASNV